MTDDSNHIFSNVYSKPHEFDIKGSPDIGLYFTCPKIVGEYDFAIWLGQAFREVNRLPYEKNMHAVEFDLPDTEEATYQTNAELVSKICKNSGIVFIVKSRIDTARKYQADGMIFDFDEKIDLQAIRDEFGDNFIIGIDCKDKPAKAKNFKDNELVDYIAFQAPAKDLIKHIHKLKETESKPIAVKGNVTPDNCEELVNSGVDFIGCGDFIWDKNENIAEATKEICEAIHKAISGRSLQ